MTRPRRRAGLLCRAIVPPEPASRCRGLGQDQSRGHFDPALGRHRARAGFHLIFYLVTSHAARKAFIGSQGVLTVAQAVGTNDLIFTSAKAL